MIKSRFFISTVLVVLLILGSVLLFYAPENQRQRALRGEAKTLLDEIAALHERSIALKGGSVGLDYPKPLIWQAQSEADAELALQEKVFDLARRHEIELTNFSSSPLSRDTGQSHFAFQFEAKGSLQGTYAFFADIEAITPLVSVATLRIRPQQRYDASEKGVYVSSQSTLWGFWSAGA